jgi:hypothetical protein
MKTNIHFWSYLLHFLLELEMFQIKILEKNTHFMYITLFRKSYRLWTWKYIVDDNMTHGHCILDT